jgi:Na+/H+-dicarboxylate symporter/ABC-type amino acid transport substrate-binding protein
MGDTKSVGRIGGKAMLWFVSASLVSLLLGLIMVNILRPGDNLNLPLPDASAATNLNAASLSFKDFVTHLVPKSAVEAMANNEILQIVVFSLFFGVAAAALGERVSGVVKIIDETSQIILTITGYIMALAPIAVFAAMAATVTTQGIGILVTYGKYLVQFYFSLGVLWLVLIAAGFLFLGRTVFRLILLIREPFLLGFSTASSEAAYPVTMAQLEKLPVSKKIISFVLPMGYSFNLDGSMMYCTFATIFIAQAYNIQLSITQQVTMLLVLMLTSKGMAGVPRASLVVIAATLVTFNLPEAGLLLIIGIDQFLDMGRTATNVIGNSLATAVIGRWEGETGRDARHPSGSTGCLMPRTLGAVALIALALAVPGAEAQELTGTLKKVKDSKTVTLGYRASSIPFSYVDKAGDPIGYSIDLCNAVVDEISKEFEGVEIGVKYEKVRAETRIPAVRSSEIDLECGSTTANFGRKKDVAFSPIFFIAGTKMLVPRSSAIASYRDLSGKTVVVTAGTTNEASLRAISDKQHLDIKLIMGRDHDESFALLREGKADAFATDDVLLYGLIATTKGGDQYHVVGDYLSYDPYGLMYRKDDPDFTTIVDRTFSRLAQSRELVQLYNKWFQQRLPTGEILDLPMSPQLAEIFRIEGVPD